MGSQPLVRFRLIARYGDMKYISQGFARSNGGATRETALAIDSPEPFDAETEKEPEPICHVNSQRNAAALKTTLAPFLQLQRRTIFRNCGSWINCPRILTPELICSCNSTLRSHRKRTARLAKRGALLVLTTLALLACNKQPAVAPSHTIAQFANPKLDAARAIAKGDFSLRGVYGYAASTPGIEGDVATLQTKFHIVMIAGTSDLIATNDPNSFNVQARNYAFQYNRFVFSKLGCNPAKPMHECARKSDSN